MLGKEPFDAMERGYGAFVRNVLVQKRGRDVHVIVSVNVPERDLAKQRGKVNAAICRWTTLARFSLGSNLGEQGKQLLVQANMVEQLEEIVDMPRLPIDGLLSREVVVAQRECLVHERPVEGVRLDGELLEAVLLDELASVALACELPDEGLDRPFRIRRGGGLSRRFRTSACHRSPEGRYRSGCIRVGCGSRPSSVFRGRAVPRSRRPLSLSSCACPRLHVRKVCRGQRPPRNGE